jgi:hypothetical protein
MQMGGEAWSYFVPYREDIAAALEDLQRREFEAGRYRKPVGPHLPATSIAEAARACDASGTGSILDMIGIADVPRPPGFRLEDVFESDVDPMFSMVAPLAPEQLLELFGTERPSREMIENSDAYYDLIDRGLGLYIVAHDGDEPSEIFFLGLSYD